MSVIRLLVAHLFLFSLMAAQDVKTINGLAIANVKTVKDLAIANVKTVNGLDNTAGGGGGGTVNIDTSALGTLNAQGVVITVGAGTVRKLYFCFAAGNNTLGTRTVISVDSSVNGAFSLVGAADDGNFCRTEWWELSNPTAGAHTITANVSGSLGVMQAFAVSVNAASGTINTGTLVAQFDTGTASGSASVTLASGDLALAGVCTDANGAVSFSPGTQLQEREGIASDVYAGIASNTGTGSVSIGFSGSAPDNGWAEAIIPISNTP